MQMSWLRSSGYASVVILVGWLTPVQAEPGLTLAYPPANHQTTAERIFLIGTAPPGEPVLINEQVVRRNAAGHFAPSFPLQVGENRFVLRYRNQEIIQTVTRLATVPIVPTGLGFAPDSLTPTVPLTRLPGEAVCFGATAPPTGKVEVQVGDRRLALQPQATAIDLPANSAVLTRQNQPVSLNTSGRFQGCMVFDRPLPPTTPRFTLTLDGKTLTQAASGSITIQSPDRVSVAIVTAEAGIARTGPSTDYSRLTPLPQGTQARITGSEGDWFRLDYGAWIRSREVQSVETTIPPFSLIRSLKTRERPGWTEVQFPLQVPVPVSLQQDDRTLTLTLHNTIAQTDTIYAHSPLIDRLDWQQISPTQVQYRIRLRPRQQWGYHLHYEGTTLVLSLRHPPNVTGSPSHGLGSASAPLQTPVPLTILLDPGHGGAGDLGARGPTGYPEKAVALTLAKLLRAELERRGVQVIMTREADVDVGLGERVARIQQVQPTIALSLHYNALPDDGDALNTQGVAAFWFHPQAHSLAVFLHDYLVRELDRPSDGVFWNNLALTRPTVALSVLLELGYMINPDEYEWIVDPQAQRQLATALADGILAWVTAQVTAKVTTQVTTQVEAQ